LSEEELRFVRTTNTYQCISCKDLYKVLREKHHLSTSKIDNTLTRLCDAMGKCEQLKYRFPNNLQHLYSLCCLFIILLPFGLISLLSWFCCATDYNNCSCFFSRKNIHLQDPLRNKPTDTPVTAIAQTIEQNLIQMVNEYQNEFENQEMIELKKVMYGNEILKIICTCTKKNRKNE
jgi:putative membrane protein